MTLTKFFQRFEVKLDEETKKQTAKGSDFYNKEIMQRLGYKLKSNKWLPKSKTKKAIANKEVDEEGDQPLLKRPSLTTEPSTSQQIAIEMYCFATKVES